MGEIIDLAEYRLKKTMSQRQFHPSITEKGVVGKAHKEIDARLREMGLNPEDYQD